MGTQVGRALSTAMVIGLLSFGLASVALALPVVDPIVDTVTTVVETAETVVSTVSYSVSTLLDPVDDVVTTLTTSVPSTTLDTTVTSLVSTTLVPTTVTTVLPTTVAPPTTVSALDAASGSTITSTGVDSPVTQPADAGDPASTVEASTTGSSLDGSTQPLRVLATTIVAPAPSPVPAVLAQPDLSMYERLLGWLSGPDGGLAAVLAGPLVAFEILLRALLSAGSGLVAPASLLTAAAVGAGLDRRRAAAAR